MLQRLFRDSAVYGLSTVFSRGVALLLIPVYTYALSPTEYGVVDFLAILAIIMNVTVALEISQGVARFYTDASKEQDKIEYASTALWFSICAYTSFLLLTVWLARPLSNFVLGSAQWEPVFSSAVLAVVFLGMFFHLQNQLRWEFRAGGYALASASFAVVGGVTAAFLLLWVQIGPQGVFYGQVTGAVAGGSVSWYLARRSFKLRFVWARWKEMVSFSLPLVVSSVAVFFSIYVDRFFIKELLGLADVGLYGVGYRLASIVGLLMAGFQGALTPLIYQNYMKPSTPQDLARIFRYFLAAVLPLALLISTFSPELVRLLTGPEYSGAWTVIPILVFGIVLGNLYIFAPGLAIAKKTSWFAIVNIGAAAINAGLNVVLIPAFGIVGAAAATTATALLAFSCFIILSQRIYVVPHEWSSVLTAVCITVFLILLMVWTTPGAEHISIQNTLLKLSVCAIGAIATARLLLRSEERAAIRFRMRFAAERK